MKKHKFLIGLFLFSFLLRCIVVLVTPTEIVSDFKTMYDASLEVLHHTTQYQSSPYFLTWGYQMGHVLYQSILLSLIESVTFLKLVNALVTSLIVVFIYLLGLKINRPKDEKAARIMGLFYAIFPFPLLLNTVLTNQHLPMLLVLIAIYLLLSIDFHRGFVLKSIGVGLLLGFANLLRSEQIIMIVAIFLFGLYLLYQKYPWQKLCSCFLLIVVFYTLLFQTVSLVLIKTNLSPSGLENKNPAWKFVVGLNNESNGMYHEGDAQLYATDYERAKDEAIHRMMDWKHLPFLFLKKTKIQWFDSDLSWSLNYDIDPTVYRVLDGWNQIWILLLHFFAGLSLFSLFGKKRTSLQVLITLILFVSFGVYLLIEIMPRYAYTAQIFEAILGSVGVSLLLHFWQKKSHTA